MNIYISVPMNGRVRSDIEQDLKEAKEIISKKYPEATLTTPYDVCDEKGKSYGYYLGKDVEFIVDSADLIVFCKGWGNSKGCIAEGAIAKTYRKEFRELASFLEDFKIFHAELVEEDEPDQWAIVVAYSQWEVIKILSEALKIDPSDVLFTIEEVSDLEVKTGQPGIAVCSLKTK